MFGGSELGEVDLHATWNLLLRIVSCSTDSRAWVWLGWHNSATVAAVGVLGWKTRERALVHFDSNLWVCVRENGLLLLLASQKRGERFVRYVSGFKADGLIC